MRERISTLCLAVILLLPFHDLLAQTYYWQYGMVDPSEERFDSPEHVCRIAYQRLGAAKYVPAYPGGSPSIWICEWWASPGFVEDYIPLYRVGTKCERGSIYSPDMGECVPQQGPPDGNLNCDTPSNSQGNPINISTGNKFQAEHDIPPSNKSPFITFSRYYNSISGLWAHTYSMRLEFEDWRISLFHPDGQRSYFIRDRQTATPRTPELGSLTKTGTNWTYRSTSSATYIFNSVGQLIGYQKEAGVEPLSVQHADQSVIVSDSFGNKLTMVSNSNSQPLTVSALGLTIAYTYNAAGYLSSRSRQFGGNIDHRFYLYEIAEKPMLLTGITDERGIRFASWSYDSQGRATSSEHADGADKVTVTYNSDGTVSVTNELGKVAKYSFQTIRGVRRITSVEGEPSPNCPSSNSTFTYDDRGLLKTKTDSKGNLTTYTYNARDLEISRTEASGTPQARTITTDWHADFFLPVKVMEPERITQYIYDAQGRQTSQSVTPR